MAAGYIDHVASLPPPSFATSLCCCALSASAAVHPLTMSWTGLCLTRTALVVLLVAGLASPFLYVDRGQRAGQSPPDPDLDDPRASLPGPPGPLYSRQATLMMAATSPRIGVRSSLLGQSGRCQVDPVQMYIRPTPRYAHVCRPATEISYGCRGGCSSYSRVDERNATNVLRSCSCCRPTGFGFRVVKLRCEGFALRTMVKFALGCHCRPCMPSVAADTQTLRDLLSKTSIASIG